jgi:3'(2'), 5'-bisphosphate nucleotidase
VEAMKKKYELVKFISAGSSLKLCLVAEGKADVYPRLGPTMEWDTAAGQVIVEQAKGSVLNIETDEPLRYNKENLLNPWFIVRKNPA